MKSKWEFANGVPPVQYPSLPIVSILSTGFLPILFFSNVFYSHPQRCGVSCGRAWESPNHTAPLGAELFSNKSVDSYRFPVMPFSLRGIVRRYRLVTRQAAFFTILFRHESRQENKIGAEQN
jgi:hypothetical protein